MVFVRKQVGGEGKGTEGKCSPAAEVNPLLGGAVRSSQGLPCWQALCPSVSGGEWAPAKGHTPAPPSLPHTVPRLTSTLGRARVGPGWVSGMQSSASAACPRSHRLPPGLLSLDSPVTGERAPPPQVIRYPKSGGEPAQPRADKISFPFRPASPCEGANTL